MTRTTVTLAGGVVLALGAALAGVSLARGQSAAVGAVGVSQYPPPSHGAGYSNLDSVQPGGAWPRLPATLKGPVQPIFYRHDVHAGQFRIPCLYCHNNAVNAWTANVPALGTCMGCHLVIAAADSAGNPDPEIAKLREYATGGRTPQWVRVFKISEHAHFPHMRHVNAAIPCQTCHGNIQQMPRVFGANNVNNMGWCTSCHMRRGITRDCTACHF